MAPVTRKRKRDSERAAFNNLMIENMGYFKMLPVEIIEIVLTNLDAPSLSSISCTCKKLHEQTQKVWKVLCRKMSLDYTPTPLCVASSSVTSSLYYYDEALRKCTSDETKWRIIAIRYWLYCRWKCVVCFRNCAKRLDPHRDILLCESCHPVFYKRKSSAKEQFGLTERDLHLIVSNGYEYLITDLIFLARTKYGGKDGLEQRLREKKDLKMRREAEKECSLVERESEVADALLRNGSSFSDVRVVDSRFMPYVSIPATYRRCSSQTADDAAYWLISMKGRYKARYKCLLNQILMQCSRCKGCKNYPSQSSIGPMTACSHIIPQEASKTFSFIKENFSHDIQAYMKSGLLNDSQTGPQDCEKWAAAELFERAERKVNLKKALQDLEDEWPPIVKEGIKDPLRCSMAEDFVQKGVVVLQHQVGKCRLKHAKDIARVILAAARGWQSRNSELKSLMEGRGFFEPFDRLKPECKSLMEDYVDHMVIVRNCNMVACSAFEVVSKISALQGMTSEPGSPTTKRCSRIYNECFPQEDPTLLMNNREKTLKARMAVLATSGQAVEDRKYAKSPIDEFIKTGSTSSLFGYKLTTSEAVVEIAKLRTKVESQKYFSVDNHSDESPPDVSTMQ